MTSPGLANKRSCKGWSSDNMHLVTQSYSMSEGRSKASEVALPAHRPHPQPIITLPTPEA